MSQGLDFNKPAFLDPLLSGPVRVNFEAVATGNLGPSAPSNPKEGQEWIDTSDGSNIRLRKFLLGGWVTILENITSGPPVQNGAQPVEHTQASPGATTWNITHSLGTKAIIYQFWNDSDEAIEPDTVVAVDDNNLQATFLVQTAGRAVIIG